jgi:hypothetical protein
MKPITHTYLPNPLISKLASIKLHDVNLFLIFILAPIADNLTGFLLFKDILVSDSNSISPSIILRLGIMGISMAYLKKGIQFNSIVIFIIYIIFLELLSFFVIHHNPTGIFVGLNWSTKIIYAMMLGLFLFNMVKDGVLTFESLLLRFRTTVIIYALVIFIPFWFGIGNPTYGRYSQTFGKMGFLANGNGAGTLQGIGSIVSLYIFMSKKTLKNFLLYLLNLSTCYIIATKGTMLYTLINALLWFWHVRFHIKLLAITAIAFVFSQLSSNILYTVFKSYDVIRYRYERAPDFFSFLFSGRDLYLSNAIENYNINDFASLRLLSGFGAFTSFRNTGYSFSSTQSRYFLEAEMFDMFFMYGFIGWFLYMSFFFVTLILSIRNRRFHYFLPWGLCWFYSMFAGHMLFNGMSILAIMVLFNLIIQPTQKDCLYDRYNYLKK